MFALLTKTDDLKTLREALTLKNHCVTELVAEAKKLRERVTEHKKINVVAKPTSQSCGKECATAVDISVRQ